MSINRFLSVSIQDLSQEALAELKIAVEEHIKPEATKPSEPDPDNLEDIFFSVISEIEEKKFHNLQEDLGEEIEVKATVQTEFYLYVSKTSSNEVKVSNYEGNIPNLPSSAAKAGIKEWKRRLQEHKDYALSLFSKYKEKMEELYGHKITSKVFVEYVVNSLV